MNKRDLKNNNNSNLEWTPVQIAEYMAEQFKDYIIPFGNIQNQFGNQNQPELLQALNIQSQNQQFQSQNIQNHSSETSGNIHKYSILDPCCGSANLITAIYKMYSQQLGNIYEFEILPELIPLMKTNAILGNYVNQTATYIVYL